MNIVAVIGSVILLAFGVWLLYGARDLIRLGLASYRWNKAEGIVVDSRDDSFLISGLDRNSGVGAVKYKETAHDYVYEVAGKTYKGSTYCFGGHIERAEAAYLIGTRVTVYYDPKNPALAVLRPGLQLSAAFGLMLFGAGLVWLYFAF